MSVYNFDQLDKPQAMDDFLGSQDEADDSMLHDENQSEAIAPEKNVTNTLKSNGKSKSNSQVEFVELDFEFFCGSKKNSKILATASDFNQYSKHGTCARGMRYRCKDRKCRAFVILCADGSCIRLKSSPRHKHHKTQSKMETDYWNLVVRHEMRQQCTNLATLAGGKHWPKNARNSTP